MPGPFTMRAADLGRRAEQVGVALKLPVATPEHVPREDDPGVGAAPDLADVVIGLGRTADDHQLHPGGPRAIDAAERVDQHVWVVLGLQAADEQDVAAGFEAEPVQRLRLVVTGSCTPYGITPIRWPYRRAKTSATA